LYQTFHHRGKQPLGCSCNLKIIHQKQRIKAHVHAGIAKPHYFSFTTIRRASRLLVTFGAVVVIIGPTFALYAEKRTNVRLSLIMAFTLVFAAVVIATTSCKHQEMFAIVAASVDHSFRLESFLVLMSELILSYRYAAVMIVFVGSGTSLAT
jgi:hypothetical protein